MSTLFQDNFTNSGSDTDINAWQSTEQSSGSADWAYHAPTTATAVFRSDASSDVFCCDSANIANGFGESGLDVNNVRVINAALSGVNDYKVSATLSYNNTFEQAHLLARLQTGAYSGYRVRQKEGVNQLHKMVAGVATLLDSDGTLTGNYESFIQVVGSTITWRVGNTMTPKVVTDATYSTGPPGLGATTWNAIFGVPTESEVFVDSFLVESVGGDPVTLTATTNTITLTAPTVPAINLTMPVTTNLITVTAPTAVLAGATTLTATANTITLTAPTVPAVTLTMPVTTNTITLTAPTAGLNTAIHRKFPLVRTEMNAISQFPNHVFPLVAYQDTSLIP